MARAVWKGVVVAESDRRETVEGNKYFPPNAVRRVYFPASMTRTVCGWEGTAGYFDVFGDEVKRNAAWFYPDTKSAAANIKGYIAFWRGVKVERGNSRRPIRA